VSNCTVDLGEPTTRNLVGKEVTLNFTQNRSGQITCQRTVNPMTHCKASEITSLQTEQDLEFEPNNGLCQTVSNKTSHELVLGDVNASWENETSQDVALTHDIPFTKNIDLWGWNVNDVDPSINMHVTPKVHVGLTQAWGEDVPGCQLDITSQNYKTYKGKVLTLHVSNANGAYACTQSLSDAPKDDMAVANAKRVRPNAVKHSMTKRRQPKLLRKLLLHLK